VIAEPAAPRGRDPFAPLQFVFRPGNGMDEGESSEGLPVMAMLVMTAAPVPPVMVSASPVHVSVAAAAPMLDLNHSAVLRGHRGDAQPGRSGYGHCQQRKTNQADTSHTVSSRSRDCDVRHKITVERFVPARMK
jgi:hypothetical protein